VTESDLIYSDVYGKAQKVAQLVDVWGIFIPKVGEYYPSSLMSYYGDYLAAWPANLLTAMYYPVFVKCRFDRIGIYIGTAQAGGLTRLGIYDHDPVNFKPRTLLLDAGEVDASTTGIKELIIDITLSRGIYWLALNGNVANIGYYFASGYLPFFGLVNIRGAYGRYQASQAYGPMPSTFPSGAYQISFPKMSLRVAEVLE